MKSQKNEISIKAMATIQSVHLNIVLVEAVDAYDCLRNTREDFENELADIIICILSISGAEKIDIEYAISRKMLINEGRAKNDSKE